jgi:hypothetical protein
VRRAAQVTTVPRMLKPIRTPAVTRNFLLLMTDLLPLGGRGVRTSQASGVSSVSLNPGATVGVRPGSDMWWTPGWFALSSRRRRQFIRRLAS